MVESDYKNEATVFSAVSADNTVLILHHVAETMLRKEILAKIAELHPAVASHEYNLLFEATNRMGATQ